MKAQFFIGQSVILGASFSRRFAICGIITGCKYSDKIGMYIYQIKGEDGQEYAGTAADIIEA